MSSCAINTFQNYIKKHSPANTKNVFFYTSNINHQFIASSSYILFTHGLPSDVHIKIPKHTHDEQRWHHYKSIFAAAKWQPPLTLTNKQTDKKKCCLFENDNEFKGWLVCLLTGLSKHVCNLRINLAIIYLHSAMNKSCIMNFSVGFSKPPMYMNVCI